MMKAYNNNLLKSSLKDNFDRIKAYQELLPYTIIDDRRNNIYYKKINEDKTNKHSKIKYIDLLNDNLKSSPTKNQLNNIISDNNIFLDENKIKTNFNETTEVDSINLNNNVDSCYSEDILKSVEEKFENHYTKYTDYTDIIIKVKENNGFTIVITHEDIIAPDDIANVTTLTNTSQLIGDDQLQIRTDDQQKLQK